MSAAARFRWWYLLAIGGVLLLLGAFLLDGAAQAWMQQEQTPGLRHLMRNVSRWGDWPSHVLAGLVGAGVAYAAGSRRWIAICLALVLACAVAGSINRVIKIAAGRSRPSVTTDAGWHGPRLSSRYNAFPSGHTAVTTGFFTALLCARRRLGLVLLPIPLLIAFSRLYLGAHHLSDVVFGAMLGVACGLLVWRWVERKAGLSSA